MMSVTAMSSETIGGAAAPRSRDFIDDTTSCTFDTDFSALENSSKYAGYLREKFLGQSQEIWLSVISCP